MFIIILIAEAQQQIVVGKRLNVLVHRRSGRIGIRIHNGFQNPLMRTMAFGVSEFHDKIAQNVIQHTTNHGQQGNYKRILPDLRQFGMELNVRL